MRIEKAAIEDADLLVYFIKRLAEYEAFPFDVTVTADDLRVNLLSPSSTAEAVLLYAGEKPCGFAVYYYTFSTTTGKRGLHLDDLFIEPEYQGRGWGKQVLVYLSKLAVENQCARFEWWALKTNVSAIKFYERIGAQQLDELAIFRMDKSGTSGLAKMV
ncbi:GNAT family N-acetyltransferase [Photobacterium ganghwense]|uniref:GNAT family N-acetyltransferase n=1 Tax=Photobacterium ganghwense TaxID=320778 RepID=UPI004056FBA2